MLRSAKKRLVWDAAFRRARRVPEEEGAGVAGQDGREREEEPQPTRGDGDGDDGEGGEGKARQRQKRDAGSVHDDSGDQGQGIRLTDGGRTRSVTASDPALPRDPNDLADDVVEPLLDPAEVLLHFARRRTTVRRLPRVRLHPLDLAEELHHPVP